MEPELLVGAALLTSARQDTLKKLLGPSADYIGQRAKGLIEKCDVNVSRVFRYAFARLGPRIDEPGGVNARVLRRIIDESLFCEDELTAAYLGGVLASARSESLRDDRSICYLKIIESLSAYQLRVHFLVYSALASSILKRERDNRAWDEGFECTLAYTEDSFIDAMEFADGENVPAITTHSFLGLEEQGLCDSYFGVIKAWPEEKRFAVPFRCAWPTRYGFMLFLWGNGFGHINPRSFFELDPEQVPRLTYELEVLTIAYGAVSWHGDIEEAQRKRRRSENRGQWDWVVR